MTAKSDTPVLAVLQQEPARFGFDAAIRVVMQATRQGRVSRAVRLCASSALSYPASAILRFEPASSGADASPSLTLGLPGLAGAGGVLPRHYSGLLAEGRGAALSSVLDLVSERMLADLAEAGIKYRMERAAEAARLSSPGRPSLPEYALLALAGFASPSMLARLKSGRRSILYYAGLFAAGPRSADRLAALAADWLGHPVEIVEFVGAWLSIDATEQTRLPQGRSGGAHCRLGMDATAGARVWDTNARVTLRIGPLGRGAFEALLPDQGKLAMFADLLRAYLGLRTAFRVNLVLKAEEVTHARLADGDKAFARLGWNSWIQPHLARVGVDADDVAFAL